MKLSIDQSRITSDFTKKFDIVHVAWKNMVSIEDDDAFATLLRQTQEQFPGQGELNALHALKLSPGVEEAGMILADDFVADYHQIQDIWDVM